MYGLSAIVGSRSAFVLSVHVTSWLSSASGHCKVRWFSGIFFILSPEIYGTLIIMMVCTSVLKSSGPCVCMCVCSLVLQRLRHLASFCMLLSCFVCRGIPCICSCNAIQFLLQLSRSLGSQLENGLTYASFSRLDSSTADKMQNFWQDGVCSCMLVACHGFFFVRTILLGYCHDLVYDLPLPGFVLSACAVWIASLTLFNSASFSVSLSVVSRTTS